jgi:hypothetical protein
MTMRAVHRASLLTTISCAVLSSAGLAQLSLMDASAQLVGAVVEVEPVYLQVLVPTSSGEPAVVRFDAGGAVATEPVLFLTTNCTGTPYAFANSVSSARRLVYAINGTDLYQQTAEDPVVLAAQSQLDPLSGACSSFSPLPFQAQSLELAAALTFTPPLRVVRGGSRIFADGFELGNPSRWSNL